jgi:hypothetical protein
MLPNFNMLKTYKQVNSQGIIGGDLVKPLQLLLIFTSISTICILGLSQVSALNQNEASVSLSWLSETFYQGNSASVRITFNSNSSEELRIYNIGVQFDWMSSDAFYGPNLSTNPVSIPSYGSHTFDFITIPIPSNVSVGSHTCFVGIDGLQVGQSMSDFSWDSPTSTIQIHDTFEKLYNDLFHQVSSKMSEAQNANYESAEAKSLFQQATNEYNLATSLADQGKWREATSSLQNVSSYLENANAEEQISDEQKANQQTLLLYLAVVAIVVIIAISIIVVIVRKKRKQTKSAVDQSLET